MVDFRKCQTATVTPAEPGGFPFGLTCDERCAEATARFGAQTAQHYAEFLAANKARGHEADGKIPQQRTEEKGYPCPAQG